MSELKIEVSRRWCVMVNREKPWRADIVQQTNTSNSWPLLARDIDYSTAHSLVSLHNAQAGESNEGIVIGEPQDEPGPMTDEEVQRIADDLSECRSGKFESALEKRPNEVQIALFVARLTPLLVGRGYQTMIAALNEMAEE